MVALCLRPRAWWYFALLPLATVTAATVSRETVLGAAVGAAHAACLLGFAYGLNAITDAATDRSTTKNPLAGKGSVPVSARLAVGACAAAAVLLALGRGGPNAVIATAVVLVISFAYSAPPRLKAIPFIGTALNAGIFTPLFWLGAEGAPIAPALPILFTGLLLQNQLLHEREDLEEDVAAGVVTTAACLGDRGTRAGVVVIGAATLAALAEISSKALFAASAIGLAVATSLVIAPYRGRRRHRNLAAAAGATAYLLAAWAPT